MEQEVTEHIVKRCPRCGQPLEIKRNRTPPPATIDHAAALRDRLGRAAYEAATGSEGDSTWETANATSKELYRRVGQAVMNVIVPRDERRGDFTVSSIYGYKNQTPYVNVETSMSPMQMSPAKAREIALMPLESADASESDAVMIGYARDVLDMDEKGAAQLLAQLRHYREKQRGTEARSA
jgi:hypothetical protein